MSTLRLSRPPLSPRQRSTLAYLLARGERVPTMRAAMNGGGR
jgi:hypothetical protein